MALISMSKRVAVSVGLIGTLLLTGACSSKSGGGTPGTPATVAPPALGAALAPASAPAAVAGEPVNAYGSGITSSTTLLRARGIIVSGCMTKRGFDDMTAGAIDTDIFDIDTGSTAPTGAAGAFGAWGYVGSALAAQYGFSGGGQGAGSSGDNPLGTDSGPKMNAWGQCLQQAQSTLQNGQPMPDLALVDQVTAESNSDTAKDARVVAATKAWATCMQADGYNDTNPATAQNGTPTTGSGSSSDQDILTAKADAACTTSTNLAGIYFAALYGYQNEFIAANQQALDQVKQQIDAQISYAQKLLTSG